MTSRIRAGLLQHLTAAPLSEWPQALVRCLDSLSASGVCRDADGAESSNEALDEPARASPQVRRVRAFIRAHYADPISLESVAASVGRNAAYMATLFRRQTGTTIHRYLTRVRMQRAALLLRRSEKVEAVILLVGYRSKKNFYRQFERTFRVMPGQYKVRHLQRRPRGERYPRNG